MTDRELIVEATKQHQKIEFGYDGFRRVGDPHIIGTDKVGATTVFVWQTLSGKGGVPGWRHFPLDGLSGLRPTGNSFAPQQPRPDPSKCGFVTVTAKA